MEKRINQPSRCQRILRTLYNREKHSILGRTPKSWGLIFIYYVIAYTFLTGFFVGMISVFMYGYIDDHVPSLTGMQSLLKLNPGVAYAPQQSVKNSLSQFTAYQSNMNALYLEKVNELLQSFSPSELNSDCRDGVTPAEFPDTPCRFNITVLGVCEKPEEQLALGNPCIYLSLNRIFGWLPSIANETEFPSAAIRCTGQNSVDDFLLGQPTYSPEYIAPDGVKYGSIENHFFPFVQQKGYQQPWIAVQFPEMKRNTVVMVTCAVYGLNGVDSSVQFEIVVDDKPTL